MTKEKQDQEFNPWPSYFMIGAGVCLLIVSFIRDNEQWSTIDLLKVGAGVAMIGYGTFNLIKKK